MPRFVLIRHECPPGAATPSHWDLMLERNARLLTWRISELPTATSRAASNMASIPAKRLDDHRLEYLDFEGTLSQNRGSVWRVDRGELSWLVFTPDAVEAGVSGSLLNGHIVLTQQSSAPNSCWRLQLIGEAPTEKQSETT